MGLVIFGVVALVLVLVIVVAARRPAAAAARHRATVQPDGLRAVDDTGMLAWSAIESVSVLTDHRRLLRRTRFVFVAEGEGETMVLSSLTGEGQRFLAESHRLAGFDQRLVVQVLSTPQSQRQVCFRRPGGAA